MFVDASETPFLSSIILCFYVLEIITPKGLVPLLLSINSNLKVFLLSFIFNYSK